MMFNLRMALKLKDQKAMVISRASTHQALLCFFILVSRDIFVAVPSCQLLELLFMFYKRKNSYCRKINLGPLDTFLNTNKSIITLGNCSKAEGRTCELTIELFSNDKQPNDRYCSVPKGESPRNVRVSP